MATQEPLIPPLNPLYINVRRVAALVGTAAVVAAVNKIPLWNPKQDAALRAVSCAELLRAWLMQAAGEIKSIHEACLTGTVRPKQLVSYEGHLFLRNAKGRNSGVAPLAHVTLGQLGEMGSDCRLEFPMNPDHLVVGSPGDLLKGTVSALFVVAQIQSADPALVSAVPIFIGNLRSQGPFELPLSLSRNEVFIEDIDTFSLAHNSNRPAKAWLEALRDVPEHRIKHAFAEIIGEPDVPKDWGGERADLLTTYLKVNGRRVSTAFAFKGPAGGQKFREMKMPDLGKNGDQIERLVTTSADLLVVQHCHKIGHAVRNTIRAFCNQIGRQREYCLINGYETFRVLKAYGKCGL